MSAPYPVDIAVSEDDYEKRQKDYQKKVDNIAKEAKNNKVLEHMQEEHEKSETREERARDNSFRFIHQAIYAAEQMYEEGEIDMPQAIDDVVEALTLCKKHYKDGSSKEDRKTKKENKALARDMGY